MHAASPDHKPAPAAPAPAAANKRSNKPEAKRPSGFPPSRHSRNLPSIYSLYGTKIPAPRDAQTNSTGVGSVKQQEQQQMPYYVVPVLYVPKRIVPTDEFNATHVQTQRQSRRIVPHPERSHPASAPGRLQMRAESSLQRNVRHHPSGCPSARTSFYYVNKRLRSSTFALDPNLGKVTEETEQERADEVVVPTRDVVVAPPKDPKKKSSRIRDETVHEVRRRLLEALEMVELFEEKKELASTGTQCESEEAQETQDAQEAESTNRPFNNISRLEASLKRMRKYL